MTAGSVSVQIKLTEGENLDLFSSPFRTVIHVLFPAVTVRHPTYQLYVMMFLSIPLISKVTVLLTVIQLTAQIIFFHDLRKSDWHRISGCIDSFFISHLRQNRLKEMGASAKH